MMKCRNWFLASVLLGMSVLASFPVSMAKAEMQSVPVGGTLYLGRYEQDNDLSNGAEPIEWQVLDADTDEALLISRYVLDCQPYHEKKGAMTWENSTLRQWLTEHFYEEAFTEAEQAIILTSHNSNEAEKVNEDWISDGGAGTFDRVFLLSVNELRQYFPDEKAFKTAGTAYARALGAKFLGVTSIGVGDTDWWLRSPGKEQHDAAYVGTLVHSIHTKSVTDKIGVRPVIRIKREADWSAFPYQQMEKASAQAEQGEYMKAVETLQTLGTYGGSVETIGRYLYSYALQAGENGEHLTAIERMEAYRNYMADHELELDEGFLEALPEAYYQIGLKQKASGEYQAAIETFSKVSQYGDAMEQIKSCFDKLHIPYSWLTKKLGDVVNTGTNNGYSGKQEIKGDDPHFGWALGRFMLSGYTEMTESNGMPVFIKTPGDKLVLWFDLDQNMDQLNGDSDLSIAEDKDGFDQEFGFRKTNMGRGALLIRHTDHRNADGEPVAYLNYLGASELGTPNTRVEVAEEGTYEVALDYEIHDANLKHVLKSTQNYRIRFQFMVKNGSSMFYLFDADTGDELEDWSRTSHGFRIDLARSHSLKIHVVRHALNQAGTSLDVRSSAPASDGEVFDRTGYYMVTIQNTETGETLTKHIFVGGKGDLKEYQDADNSLVSFGES